eukprot:snap_masked-scaffold_35-processed-gene-2.19-mRNA-1 protein AED:1.00 eAED:1.00 QI:0/-1/0/0/-1/1/1/0/239
MKQTLDEETYLTALSSIIKREFFPSNRSKKEDAKNEITSMSLNDFFQKFSSEDNSSFGKIQEKEFKHLKKTKPWAFSKDIETFQSLTNSSHRIINKKHVKLLQDSVSNRLKEIEQEQTRLLQDVSEGQKKDILKRFEEKKPSINFENTFSIDPISKRRRKLSLLGSSSISGSVFSGQTSSLKKDMLPQVNGYGFCVPPTDKTEAIGRKMADDIDARKERERKENREKQLHKLLKLKRKR